MTDRPLTAKQQRFVELYLVSLNASQAYREAFGCRPKVAEANSPRLMADPRIQAAIQKAMRARSDRTEITQDQVVQDLYAICTADRNELVEHRQVPCRYCYGKGFRYQSTRAELERDRAEWEERQTKRSKEVFDERGGDGYTTAREPNPDCPECFGEGVTRVIVKDTRRLSPAGRKIYAGIRQTKDFTEIRIEDRSWAYQLVCKHLGIGQEGPPPPAEDPESFAAKAKAALAAMDTVTGEAA